MTSHIRNTATILALLAGIGVAVAQSPSAPAGSMPPARAPAAAQPAAPSAQPAAAVQLSAAQKTAIFQSVTKEKVKSPPPANAQLSVGAQVPSTIELYPLPANVVAQVPTAKQYKYTVAQNQVVLVDPASMKVVDIIKQ
jgi:Protein of unknown function (DUF1236)